MFAATSGLAALLLPVVLLLAGAPLRATAQSSSFADGPYDAVGTWTGGVPAAATDARALLGAAPTAIGRTAR